MAISMEQVIEEAIALLAPLPSYFSSTTALVSVFNRLGYSISATELAPIATDISQLSDDINTLVELGDKFQIDREAGTAGLSELAELIKAISRIMERLGQLPEKLPGINLSPSFFTDFLNLFLVDFLDHQRPALRAFLEFVGVLEQVYMPVQPGVTEVGFNKIQFHWSRLTDFVQNPGQWAENLYGWGTSNFSHEVFLLRLSSITDSLGLFSPVVEIAPEILTKYYPSGINAPYRPQAIEFPLYQDGIQMIEEDAAIEIGLMGLPVDGKQSPTAEDVGIGIIPYSRGLAEGTLSISPELDLVFRGSADLAGGLVMALRPKSDLELSADLDSVASNANFRIEFQRKPSPGQSTVVLLGEPDSSRLDAQQVFFGGGIEVRNMQPGVVIEGGIKQGRLVITMTEADGFLQKMLPKDGLQLDFDIAIGWSNTRKLYFSGGAGLEATFPINKELLGVLVINSVYLAIFAKESGISLAAAASVTLKLGPVTAAIQQMGLRAMLTFPEKGGNLGPVNLEIGFKPPNGVGLVIDTSVVVGAGFLEFDLDNQMYSGFVYLEIIKKISVTAVGLITTRMPDGSPGFSLLALVAVQFSPGVQLGYGFTLNGLGGILGINRTVAVEVLRAGLRNGTLGSILFPADPKKNIARIISDLKAVFPPAEGRFLFGPMVILGWGPNELIKLELGLILELPDPVRLLILGRLSLKLPDEKNAVVRLKLDSFGVIDFSTGDVSLDAVLYDSEIKGFTITGDMALRANFGAAPGFLLSVGGFHPAFKPPPGFPALQRVAISLATGDNPRLRLAAYMAITTNTIQFGAALEIYAKVDPFSLVGQLNFDALIQFDPFGLAIGLGGMIAIKWNEEVILGLMLEMNLTGPTPWHAWGGVQFKFLLFDAKIPFDVITGESQLLPSPMPVDLTNMVLKALKDSTNWSTQLPSNEHPLVVFREQTKQQDILVHPLAMLQVSQRVAPLNKSLYKFGNAPLEGGEQFFSLSVSGAAIHDSDYVEDWFAPAHFMEMNDDEKLAADSFEKKKAGIRFTQNGYICGSFIEEDEMEYDTETLGGNQSAVSRGLTAQPVRESEPYVITSEFLQQVASTGAVGQSLLQKTGNTKYQIAAVKESILTSVFTVKPRSFSIVGGDVSVESGNVIGTPTTFPMMMNITSYTAALEVLKENQVTFLKTRERLKIIPIVGGVSDE